MKRILFLTVAAGLLFTGPAGAHLTVYEYVPGEKVILDDYTGNYWYWNLPDFTNMTYDEQIAAIAGLGTYGNIAGGWHMANRDEIMTLPSCYAPQHIAVVFEPSGIEWLPLEDVTYWYGRIDYHPDTDGHAAWGIQRSHYGDYNEISVHPHQIPDNITENYLSAWVVTGQSVVPVPGSLILAATGLLSVRLCLNRLRRKH